MNDREKNGTNIAVFGYGMIGRVHSVNYREIPFLYPGTIPPPILHTVCTARQESALAAQREAGFARATTDPDSVLTDQGISVVDISLPNGLHRPIIERALSAGKNVYCEKPLAGTISDARAIADSVSRSPAAFGMVFQYRFFPAIIRAKQLLDEGRLGRVFTYRAEYLHTGYQNPDRPLTWRMKKEEGGSGALGDLGSHVIDLVRYLLGEFSSVQGNLHTFIGERPIPGTPHETGHVTVDDVAWLQARMAGGAIGTIEASRFATGTMDDLKLQIYGENGALRFNLMDPGYLEFFDEKNSGGDYGGSRGWQRIETAGFYPGAMTPPARAPIGWIRAHAENQYQFLKAVHEGRTPSPGIRDGLRTQLVIDAVERSHAEKGAWTAVEQE